MSPRPPRFRVQGFGFRVSSFEFWISSFGFRVSGFGGRTRQRGRVGTRRRCTRGHRSFSLSRALSLALFHTHTHAHNTHTHTHTLSLPACLPACLPVSFSLCLSVSLALFAEGGCVRNSRGEFRRDGLAREAIVVARTREQEGRPHVGDRDQRRS